ncbi:MAG: thiamine phosphate synthase, partial [Alphaproteobacteria bacterium]
GQYQRSLVLPQPPILVISDRHQARQPLEQMAAAIFVAGGRWLLVREKDLTPEARQALVRKIQAIARPYGATVMVSGDVAAVGTSGAAGVHLPDGSDVAAVRAVLGAGALIGYSAHDRAGAMVAAGAGADYVTLSPIFPSISKPDYGPALGLATLREVATRLPVPVLALGGVTAETVFGCLDAGAAGVAVMGVAMGATDPGAAMAGLIAKAVAPAV